MSKVVRGAYTDGDIYRQVKERYPNSINTQSYLRFEKSLNGTFNTIQFDILTNQGLTSPTERRLQITDAFTITDIGIFIMKAGTTTTATDAQRSAAAWNMWANPLIYTGAGEAAALETFYNGNLSIKVNSTVYFEALDLRSNFYRVGTSQKGVGPAVIISSDEFPANAGLKRIVPTITLNGAAKNDLTINLPLSTNTIGTTSENFVVCFCRGFLSQNASKLN